MINQEKIDYITNDMTASLYHRGPDGNGCVVFNKDFNTKVALVHTRLSIIDLDKNANQPMSYNKKLWISFNGEIYNYREIKNDLISQGFKFQNKSDSEVILASYVKWGVEAFSKFIGMWALAIWDHEKKELILSRDRIGIKPLYYSFENNFLVFASLPQLVSKYIINKNKLKRSSLSQYLSYRHQIDNSSYFQNVHQVEPGTSIIFKNNKKYIDRYWSLPKVFKSNYNSKRNLIEKLDKILNSSVKYRMVSDVPVGSFLSGGLDSSILVWYMSKISQNPINTYSIGFKEDAFNEFYYSDLVSKECNSNHKKILLNEDEYVNSLKDLIKFKGAPLSVPNEIALFKLTENLYPDNKVILSGEGADEVFYGYGRIFSSEYDYNRVLDKNLNLTVKFKKNLKLQYGSYEFKDEISHFLKQYSYISPNMQMNIFSKDFINSLEQDNFKINYFSELIKGLDKSTLTEKYLWLFQKIHILGLLGRLDNATMANSIEGRVPFLDHRLIEFMNSISIDLKIKKFKNFNDLIKGLTSNQFSEKFNITKYILRELFKKRLPDQIVFRKKVGFPVPISNWMNNNFKFLVFEELMCSKSKTKYFFSKRYLNNILTKRNFSQKDGLMAWMLLNFEYWMREFKVSF